MKLSCRAVALAFSCLAAMAAPAAAEPLAKTLFAAERLPALGSPQSIGFYSKGCFTGGVALPLEGPHWQVMHPSRNRRWGHPAMIKLIERFSEDAYRKLGWQGLLLGDISQPRGGPMSTGHASHQIGLDADIWYWPMPKGGMSETAADRRADPSVLKKGTLEVDPHLWTPQRTALLKLVASYPQIERVLVHPGIKKELCETVKGDRSWLRKIRPFWGHDDHFHIRIGCQPGSPECKEQAAVPHDDGCGKPLAWWFTAEPWRPAKHPKPKARDVMTMAALPKACRAVLAEPAPVSAATVTLYPAGLGVAGTETAGTEAVTVTPSAYSAEHKETVPLPTSRPKEGRPLKENQ
ncbi:MAG: penicillin-insensitive murein endopeptidase [Rhizobiaceae bacterium]|nr:MAG: penicillin-insensitive murein endopeptidase [Rhizobiaceae bacterium]